MNIIGDMKQSQLIQRISESKLPKQHIEQQLVERRREGTPEGTCKQEVFATMCERD